MVHNSPASCLKGWWSAAECELGLETSRPPSTASSRTARCAGAPGGRGGGRRGAASAGGGKDLGVAMRRAADARCLSVRPKITPCKSEGAGELRSKERKGEQHRSELGVGRVPEYRSGATQRRFRARLVFTAKGRSSLSAPAAARRSRPAEECHGQLPVQRGPCQRSGRRKGDDERCATGREPAPPERGGGAAPGPPGVIGSLSSAATLENSGSAVRRREAPGWSLAPRTWRQCFTRREEVPRARSHARRSGTSRRMSSSSRTPEPLSRSRSRSSHTPPRAPARRPSSRSRRRSTWTSRARERCPTRW